MIPVESWKSLCSNIVITDGGLNLSSVSKVEIYLLLYLLSLKYLNKLFVHKIQNVVDKG